MHWRRRWLVFPHELPLALRIQLSAVPQQIGGRVLGMFNAVAARGSRNSNNRFMASC